MPAPVHARRSLPFQRPSFPSVRPCDVPDEQAVRMGIRGENRRVVSRIPGVSMGLHRGAAVGSCPTRCSRYRGVLAQGSHPRFEVLPVHASSQDGNFENFLRAGRFPCGKQEFDEPPQRSISADCALLLPATPLCQQGESPMLSEISENFRPVYAGRSIDDVARLTL